MTSTKPKINQGIVAPSPNDWITLNATISVQAKISGVLKSNAYFMHTEDLATGSLDLLESGNTILHKVNVGGEMSMEREIVSDFYEDNNISMIYGQIEETDVNLLLVFKEEVDDIALRFAKLQNRICKQYPEHTIEIFYLQEEVFTSDFIPDGFVPFLRG
ncbi:hypothetical protein [Paenibacillus sp. y28]|uniref:hypothetical protein n=1 Tax=Paenibacillus sp. y28 TaxID=3129110 RepID=UPI0030183FDF